MPTITTRPVTPDPEDLRHFVMLAEIAAHGLFADMFGRRWQAILSAIAREPRHDLSHDTAYFVEVDGQAAGLLSGMAAARKKALRARSSWMVMRYAFRALPRMTVVGIPRLPLLAWFENVPPESYYISLVAVYPEFRGRGLSRTLLEAAARAAHDQGCTSLALDTNTDNAAAIAAYRRFGFERAATSPAALGEGEETALHRMVMSLP